MTVQPLDPTKLADLLGVDLAARVEILDSVGSTNTVLLERARTTAELPDFTVLTAEEQTAGQGRLSRQWQSPKHTSLSTSFYLQPAQQDFSWLVLLLAEAAVHAAATNQIAAAIKWPNDIIAVDAGAEGEGAVVKLGGILAQLLAPHQLVIGIGLNVLATPQLPTNPAAPTKPASFADFNPQVDRTVVLAELITRFHENYRGWAQAAELGSGARWAQQRIQPRLATLGQAVKVTPVSGQPYLGRATGLGTNAELIVETERGRHELSSADITHLRPAGQE